MSFLGLNSDVRPLSLPLQPSMYSHCNKGQMIAFIEVNARNKAFQNKVSIFLGLCSSYFATIIEWLGYLIDIPYPREYKTSYIKIRRKEIRPTFKVVKFLCRYKMIFFQISRLIFEVVLW